MGESLRRPLGSCALHLCVDMQRLFSTEGPWPTPWMERVLPVIVSIAERAPERTMFTRFIPPMRPDDMAGTWRLYYEKWEEATRERIDPALLELMPPLQRLVPPARVFDKPVYSAFAGRLLNEDLQRRNVDTLIVTGSETDVCVLSTVLARSITAIAWCSCPMACAVPRTRAMTPCCRSIAIASACRSKP